ncbi:hypothetical protein FH144_01365 [Staphylococcus caledonicus]|uniref:hypothetical protein n=1 Tax=Staphylococcus sp. acrmy TaxID=2929076 RepID=UPI001F5A595E|nr:hypothetical protein [Staphylococcus sp. acrmy]MCI2947077.1 hypothetical protein [Staphylococcus sp. acrmy]
MEFLGFLIIIGLSAFFYKKIKLSLAQSIGLAIGSIILLNILFYTILFLGFKVSIILVFIVVAILLFLQRKNISDWKKGDIVVDNTIEFSSEIESMAIESDMIGENIPINRAEYFNMGTEQNISEDVYPIIYNAKPAKNEMKFMEYGYLITTNEIVLNRQIKNKNKEDKKEKYTNEKVSIPFQNLYKQYRFGKTSYLLYYERPNMIVRNLPESLANKINFVIESGWSKIVNEALKNKAFTETEVEENKQTKELEKIFENIKDNLDINNISNSMSNAQFANVSLQMNEDLNRSQINARFSERTDKTTGERVKAKGYGVAGEHAGTAFDKLKMKNAEGFGHKNKKNGPDRAVNGKFIQTKYCKNAKASVNSAFHTVDKHQTAKYIYKKKMMILEVPKDQYSEAIKEMKRKIEGGAVPHENNPNNAHKYIKKGALTYNQAQIAQTSIFDSKKHSVYIDSQGNKKTVTLAQKIKYSAGIDFIHGASTAIPGSIVSGVWMYWTCRTSGLDSKESFKKASISFIKPIAYSGFTFMIASQFAGSQAGKKLGQALINTKVVNKFAKNSSKNATKMVTGGTLIAINVAVTFGPDVYNILKGRISYKQLVKNTVATSAGSLGGLAGGAALGTSFLPGIGTVIGATIGGAISTMAVKKIMDNFVEDDAVQMIRIAKEEFIEVVIMSSVSKEEFEYIINKTFLNKDFNKILKLMYAANSHRDFIKELYNNLLIEVYEQRKGPDDAEIIAFVESVYDKNQGIV